VVSYDPTTGTLVLDVTASSGITTSGSWTLNASLDLILTPLNFKNIYLNDAATFMANESAIWQNYGATGTIPGVITTANVTAVLPSGLTSIPSNQVLINVRPGIVIKNDSGAITVMGDSINRKGIDLSGSAYGNAGGPKSVLNTGDSQTLDGHFGQYDEPIVLSLLAAGNLNFGLYQEPQIQVLLQGTSTSGNQVLRGALQLGTLSDGFSQYTDGISTAISLGNGASAWAAPFDPAAPGAYNGRSGGLGADSASYVLAAGADRYSANPLKTNPNATAATLTVAGVIDDGKVVMKDNFSLTDAVTADPLYIYNFSWSGGNTPSNTNATALIPLPPDWIGGTTSRFADYASMVRTGSGNISIATSQDLVLQSPLSLIYTAGVGYNVNGTASQPLQGFTQYKGQLSLVGGTASSLKNNFDYEPPSTFLTHGGDVSLSVGRNIVGAMTTTALFGTDDSNLPYDMTALGSQLKLQNFGAAPADPLNIVRTVIGGFNALYATDDWMRSAQVGGQTYYTLNGLSSGGSVTTGNYQLAWFTWFPYLENTIGSFGGGNITAKVGGSVSNVQFVAPTNARDAGPALVATSYAFDPKLVTDPTAIALANAGFAVSDPNPPTGGYSGLYVQGGGNVSVTAGGDITDVYTYVQNGTTTLRAGGSATQLSLATSTGDLTVQASRTIDISDKTVRPMRGMAPSVTTPWQLSGIALIQNASILSALVPFTTGSGPTEKTSQQEYLANTVLTGIVTSAPTGTLNLDAVGGLSLNVSSGGGNAWNVTQGIVPARVNLVSLQGDITNGGTFTTYPDPNGTVNLLARGSVNLNAGFNLSDAQPSIMPTLQNVVGVLGSFQTPAIQNSDPTAPGYAPQAVLVPSFEQLVTNNFFTGGALYLAG
jgi:hypothetical protein